MNTPNGLLRLSKSHIPAAANLLAEAFIADPQIKSIFPDDSMRTEQSRRLFRFLLMYCVSNGEVYASSPEIEALAAWLPYKNMNMSFGKMVAAGFIPLTCNLGRTTIRKLWKFKHFSSSLRKQLVPFDHIFLFLIAVHPNHRMQGLAAGLLRPILKGLDCSECPCYLATYNPSNVSFYEQFGFKVLRSTQVPGTDVFHYAMLRNPR